MVNKCAFCNAMAVGVVVVTIGTYLYYGPGAVLFLLSAIVQVISIAAHTINRIRKEEAENETRLKAQWLIANFGPPTPALQKYARLEE